MTLNRPLFVVALLLLVLAFLLELGSQLFKPTPSSQAATSTALVGHDVKPSSVGQPPGVGIPFLGLLDAMLVSGAVLLFIALEKPALSVRIGGVMSLILSLG